MASWRVRIALAISVLNRLSEGNVEIGLGGVLDSGSERAEAWDICRMVICAGGSNSSVVAVYVSLSTIDESCLRGRGALGANSSAEDKLE